MRRGMLAVLFALLPLLGGCMTMTRMQVEGAIAQARHELRTQPLRFEAEGYPVARIALDGSLRIGADEVALDAAQQAALLDYRQLVVAVADAGLAQGNAIARDATRGVWKAVFSGDEDAFERRIEARAAAMEAGLCLGIADIGQAEAHLLQVLPQFAPYARTTRDDIDACGKDAETTAAGPPASAAA